MAHTILQNEYNIINNIINNINYNYIHHDIHNDIHNDNLPVYIYVKFAYQTTNTNYILSRNLYLSEMIQLLREYILRDFGTHSLEYELVEAGQTMPSGVAAEEASAFVVTPETIRERFNEQNCVAFYIRLFSAISSTALRTAPTAIISDDELNYETSCMVCQETPTTLTNYFGCSHHICDGCCEGCIQAGITRCAICRHPR